MDDRARRGRVMPTLTVHHNEKPAAATIRDELDFVSTTTPLSRKDTGNELIRNRASHCKLR